MWFWFNLCFYFSLAKNRYLTGKYWCLFTSTLSLPLEHMDFTKYPSDSDICMYIFSTAESSLSHHKCISTYLYVFLPLLLIVKCQCLALRKYLHYISTVLICKLVKTMLKWFYVYVKTKLILPKHSGNRTNFSVLTGLIILETINVS